MHRHTSLAVTGSSRRAEALVILTLWLECKSVLALLQLAPPFNLPGTPRLLARAAAGGAPHHHNDQDKFEVFEGALANATDRRIEEGVPTRRVQ
jgi:hypothetical protein